MLNIITRFPPEPNGFLHFGHTKSIIQNYSGENKCHLRLDDTNPSSEKQEFVDGIIEDLKWLGYDPGQITYTSDYFDLLYEYSILLIKNGYAYVDFTEKDKMRDERHNGIENEYRNKPIEYHLNEFENMKNGKYKESECVLRLKIDMKNLNHVLRDPIAYRINHTPHYKTKNKWCMYPSYDYSHGIIDALEKITHSYCTTEFYIRRDLYFWTPFKLKELGIDLEVAEEYEYGKLLVENNILSKRNINKLILDNSVTGYDDPRLLTLRGLRRRGFTPSMIKKIVSTSGLDKKDTIVNTEFIDYVIREELNQNAHRGFAVLDPLEVEIINFDDIENKNVKHPNHPFQKDFGDHEKELSKIIYIEKEDFREIHDKNYYRFTPENKVRLKYHDFFKYKNYNDNKLTIEYTQVENPKKVKGCIHWVGKDDAVEAIFELYTDLAPNGIYDPNSKIVKYGYVEKYCLTRELWQFERLGYFKLDRYENNKPVFLRVTGLFDKNKI